MLPQHILPFKSDENQPRNKHRKAQRTGKPAYLDPNSGSLQKPIEGGLPELYAVSLYKGAIVFSEHNRTSPFHEPNGNPKQKPTDDKVKKTSPR
jgi:hypothetical protein